jgi:Plavaka transposase
LCLARPCAADGSFLDDPISEPEPAQPHNAIPDNLWAPFPDRLAYDWAQYHYVRLQSSEDEIYEGLDLWRAMVIKHEVEHSSHHVPWRNASDLYETLNSIKVGAVGWKTFKLYYSGPKLPTPPQWMEESYDLNVRDVLLVLEHQIGTTKFDGQFEHTPYAEYDHTGSCVFSNLMSGYWAYHEAV